MKIDDLVDLPEEYLEPKSVDDSIRRAEELGRILGSDMEYTITKDETDSIIDITIQFKLTDEYTEEIVATAFEGANDYESFQIALLSLLYVEFSYEPVEERLRVYEKMMKIIGNRFNK